MRLLGAGLCRRGGKHAFRGNLALFWAIRHISRRFDRTHSFILVWRQRSNLDLASCSGFGCYRQRLGCYMGHWKGVDSWDWVGGRRWGIAGNKLGYNFEALRSF